MFISFEICSLMSDPNQCVNVSDLSMTEDNPFSGFAIRFMLPWTIIFSGVAVFGLFFWKEFQFARHKLVNGGVRFSYTELIMYRMDHHFSTSDSAMAMLLMGSTFSLIISATFILYVVTGEDVGNCMWNAWVWVVDNGSHGDVEGPGRTVIAWFTTIAGMLVFAMFIGIVSDTIQETLNSFRKGRCRVIESGHTVMLGWNNKSMCILQQIALANKSEGGGTIAVLCPTSKEDMEQLLAGTIEEDGFDLHGTNVIFRTGDPLNSQSLTQVSASSARAILIMSREDLDSDEADALTVRQILVIKSLVALRGHVVAEMCRVDNVEWVAMADEEGLVDPIVPRDITGRILVQSSRVPGLGHVMDLLMAFDASSFYHRAWPQLEGKAFGEAVCRFDDAVVVGLVRAGEGEGTILVNPPSATVIGPGDEILVVAADNDAYEANGAEPDGGALLLVTVEEGENFPNLDVLDDSDSFVTLQVEGARRAPQRTSTKDNAGEAPRWSETFQLARRPDQPRLLVAAYDEDTLTGNDLIGAAQIDLAPLEGALGRPHSAWYELAGGPGGRDQSRPVRVRLTLTLFTRGLVPHPEPCRRVPEKHAWIGWRRDMTDMVKDLDTWVAPGSELWLLNAVPAAERERKLDAEGTRRELRPANLALRHVEANPLFRDHLAAPLRPLDPRTALPLAAVPPLALADFDAVVVVSDAEPVRSASAAPGGCDSAASVDSRSMATLLLAKSHLAAGGAAGGREPVVELQDPRSGSLLGQLRQREGWVGTSRLGALAMAIAAEDRKAARVYAELLSAGGAYVDIRPVTLYLGPRGGAKWRLSFWEMAEAVRTAGDTLLGYFPRGQTWAAARGTLVNPAGKAEERRWEEGDRLVVICNNGPA